ncbi:MAG TPA: phosphoribosyltransferase family protein [Spirochaetota bacterium]|nr:phosphoribosyltransferase family protein [Spirochaetota bacterium]
MNKFSGRTVLLVDDVFTTGSTINECSRQLLRCGAYAVYSITVARADPDKLTI